MTIYNLRLILSSALAGGPFPIVFVPIQEYHPASCLVTERIVNVCADVQLLQASPEISFPLNCHLCPVVGGLPTVLQLKVAVSPSARVRF